MENKSGFNVENPVGLFDKSGEESERMECTHFNMKQVRGDFTLLFLLISPSSQNYEPSNSAVPMQLPLLTPERGEEEHVRVSYVLYSKATCDLVGRLVATKIVKFN